MHYTVTEQLISAFAFAAPLLLISALQVSTHFLFDVQLGLSWIWVENPEDKFFPDVF